jgi:transcriptional regulator with GAF, ATPase, and Fis domain
MKRRVDESEFFREVTLRLCSHLEIQEGLRDCVQYIREFMPADAIYLQRMERQYKAFRIVARATPEKGEITNVLAPLSEEAMGAIAMIDSELFGHEKGTFTGAVSRRRGRFERAQGGTIFLDEIGELPSSAQVRLLRVLQEKTVERVGGSDRVGVDIRVIAATHRDLANMVREGAFREDLYFRLRVFPIDIPPLRERRGDIPELVQHVILKKAKEMKRGAIPHLFDSAMDRLTAYDWPGNVRELENVIERAMITAQEDELNFPGLEVPSGPSLPRPAADTIQSPKPAANPSESMLLDDVVSGHIRRVLEITRGRVEGEGGAAAILGVHPATLRNRMRKLGIPFGRRTSERP